MKKTLLTTTAIAVTGFAGAANAVDITAGALTMGVGGYMTNTVAYTSVGGDIGSLDFDGIDILTNAEIHFKPSLTLDNGITVGADIQLEGNTSGDQIDETYMFIKGDFGQVLIGSENSAGYKMTVAAPDVSPLFAQSSSLTAFVPYSIAAADLFRGTLGATYIENVRNNDANRLSYFSPRFGGLQLGVSYARDSGQGSTWVLNSAVVTDIIDVAANYSGSFGGVDVNASARYGTATAPVGAPTDPEVWGAGLSLGFSGFTIGGSYAEQKDAAWAFMDGEAYDVGIGYSNGPWSYSLTYFAGDNQNAGGGMDELDTIVGAAKYKVADNFSVSGFIADTEYTHPTGNTIDGTVIGVGLHFSF